MQRPQQNRNWVRDQTCQNSRWSPFELFEAYSKAKEFGFVGPTCEIAEYHWFHREKVELYMAELYNKIGTVGGHSKEPGDKPTSHP